MLWSVYVSIGLSTQQQLHPQPAPSQRAERKAFSYSGVMDRVRCKLTRGGTRVGRGVQMKTKAKKNASAALKPLAAILAPVGQV